MAIPNQSFARRLPTISPLPSNPLLSFSPMKTNTQSASLINDEQSLVSAKLSSGHAIPTYDDGFGKLYVWQTTCGNFGMVGGIVRAQTWEDAYSICEDEFFPEADETVDELRKEYGFKREHVKIVRDANGVEREYTDGCLGMPFVRWETRETPCDDENGWIENELFQEAYGFRPNGANAKDTHKHGIYAKDLNGDSLELLTPELLARLEITLEIATNE